MAKAVMICCRKCDGRGWVELTGRYLDTLILLRQHPDLNAAALGRLAGTTGNAMANRLVALERLELAAGRSNGRARLWRAV